MEEEEVAISDAVEAAVLHGHPSSSSVPVPLEQRVAAASVGALLTSLASNPLDVVKTRLQAQEAPRTKAPVSTIPAACQEYYATIMETVHGAKVPYDSRGAATAQGGEAGAVVYRGTMDALVKIARSEGVPGLYRGLAPSLAMAVPSTVLYYSLYDSLRETFHALGAGPLLAPLVSGSCSRIAAATATAPLELIRTRMQAEAVGSMTKTTVEGMLGVVRASGFLSLWHGLGAQLWRDVPFSAMYWLGYEQLARALDQRGDESQASYMLKSFSAGAGAGMAAAFLTTPFDVIKTRRQVSLPAGNANAPGSPALPRQAMPSMQTALRCVVATEGYPALFSGALPRTLRIGLACAIMISSYEGGKFLLLRERRRAAASGAAGAGAAAAAAAAAAQLPRPGGDGRRPAERHGKGANAGRESEKSGGTHPVSPLATAATRTLPST